jgi:hypothetical protein
MPAPRPLSFAQAQGAKAIGVLDADQLTPAGEHHHGKSPFHPGHRCLEGLFESQIQISYEQVQEHLAVHGRLENGPGFLQLGFDMMGIDQVAVVGHGIGPVAVAHHQRLGVGHHRTARGGIAHVADGTGTVQAIEDVHVENIGNQPHPLVLVDGTGLGNGDAGTFLAPVLEGIQPEITHFSRIRMAKAPKRPQASRGLSSHTVPGKFVC